MSDMGKILIDVFIILMLVVGISLFRNPKGARKGNATAALALFLSIVLVLYNHEILDWTTLVVSLLIGGAVGTFVAMRVTMIQIPSMVAFQHGMGGIAACSIAYVELTRAGGHVSMVGEVSGYLGLTIGAATFSGSILAALKLAAKIRQTPSVYPNHNAILIALLATIVGLCVYAGNTEDIAVNLALIGALIGSAILGYVFSVRIGGADMPVLISFLNATAGLAAAFCGVVIDNRLLIAAGATIAASGSILTAVMCKAMNRSFVNVLTGGKMTAGALPAKKPATKKPIKKEEPAKKDEPKETKPKALPRTGPEAMERAMDLLAEAKSVIIVPGYGMALARAQFQVASLSNRLEKLGKTVAFAIHPVAGRMPGHMNVLLAEADVDYEFLKEMEEINDSFKETDLVLVIGACDVVNPAAIELPDTPISGMPILNAHEAKNVLVCNLDERPGYSGVPNTLYDEESTLLLYGDANASVTKLLESLSEDRKAKKKEEPVEAKADESDTARTGPAALERAKKLLAAAQSVIIVPGYGMALARAQFQVAALSNRMEKLGKSVAFGIHPVAGRMPGHMNVLLAEADVDYEFLKEMEEINDTFKDTDLVLVIGACDVVNPAAIELPDTPISGMPILNAHEAKNTLICNLDERPGYSGVPNTLYDEQSTLLLYGDANATVTALLESLSDEALAAAKEAKAPAAEKTEEKTEEKADSGDADRTGPGAMAKAKSLLAEAKSVIIVPGYGMALARAQFQVASLSNRLEKLGKSVAFGIHPVAGRMPGHMNVLLAEADVDYELLKEMDEVNDSFGETDLVLVIGACDVVNPAAIELPDTPISGMPILNAHEAKHTIVCNLDERPGYSGVPNSLYDEETTLLLFGDALATITELLQSLSND